MYLVANELRKNNVEVKGRNKITNSRSAPCSSPIALDIVPTVDRNPLNKNVPMMHSPENRDEANLLLFYKWKMFEFCLQIGRLNTSPN